MAVAGGKYVNVLGAETARQRLDEILVFIAPVLVGDGVKLERLSLSSASPSTNLWFRVA